MNDEKMKDNKWIDSLEMLESFEKYCFNMAFSSALLTVGIQTFYALKKKNDVRDKEDER